MSDLLNRQYVLVLQKILCHIIQLIIFSKTGWMAAICLIFMRFFCEPAACILLVDCCSNSIRAVFRQALVPTDIGDPGAQTVEGLTDIGDPGAQTVEGSWALAGYTLSTRFDVFVSATALSAATTLQRLALCPFIKFPRLVRLKCCNLHACSLNQHYTIWMHFIIFLENIICMLRNGMSE